jgi:hypothetical protein
VAGDAKSTKKERARHATKRKKKYILRQRGQRLNRRGDRKPGKGGGFKMKRKKPRISGGIGAHRQTGPIVRPSGYPFRVIEGLVTPVGDSGPNNERTLRGSTSEKGLSVVF